MTEYLDNPRRALRAPIRCRALVTRASGATETATEDIGARGCQLILPEPCARGDAVGLSITAPRLSWPLRLSGRVAWVSPRPPWRLGVAFAPGALPEAARWMEALVGADPSVLDFPRPPERVALDATIYLGTPPGPAVAFGEDELTVLRTVGLGLPLRAVRDRLTLGWPRMQRAIFSLLTRRSLTLSRASSSHPRAWERVLGTQEPAAGTLGDGVFTARTVPSPFVNDAAVPPRAAAPPGPTPTGPPSAAAPPVRPAARPQVVPPPLPPPATPAPPGRSATGGARHAPDFSGAGVGWRSAAGPRSPQAQELLDHGLAELGLERNAAALDLLRRALALAPGDPEIAAAIGRAMGRGGAEPPS